MIKKLSLTVCFLFACMRGAYALDFYGYITVDEVPVPYATVVLVEINQLETSDEEGKFIFYDLEEGTYSLLILTAENKEFNFNLEITEDNSDDPENFELTTGDDEDLVSETIEVTAEKELLEAPNVLNFDEDLVENIPVPNNDPFNIITTEAGVSQSQIEPFGPPFFIDPMSGNFFSVSSSYSVFGGDSSWNQAYLDFLPIPSNTHPADNTKPIITKEAISTITTIKGPPPGIYGQSLGGTVIVYPEEVDSTKLDIGLSITDPFLSYSAKINKHLSIFTLARQSIAQFTIFPIIELIIEAADDPTSTDITNYLYGDWLFSLKYAKEKDVVKLITLAYYDIVKVSAKTTTVDLVTNNFPYFLEGGLQWNRIVGERGFNELDFFSYYYTTKIDSNLTVKEIEDEDRKQAQKANVSLFRGYDYKGTSKILDFGLKEVFSYALSDAHLLSFGTTLQYMSLSATYEDIYSYETPDTQEIKKDALPEYGVDEQYFHSYAFAQYSFERNYVGRSFKASISPGLSWIYPDSEKVFPSASGEFSVTFSDKYILSFSAGWSPAFLEKLQYIDRKILEKTLNYEAGTTHYTDPNYGLMMFTKFLVQLGNHRLSVSPFLGWYYNFTGIFSQFKYDSRENPRGFSYLPIDYGYGTGASFQWQYLTEKHVFDMSYTLGFTYFKTSDTGWLPANNDYRHAIKLSYLYKVHPTFNFSLTNSYYIDIPFTPTEMQSSENGLVKQNGTVNSARSFVPDWSLVPAISGDFINNARIELSYRFVFGDILDWLVLTDTELRDSSYEGASNKDPENRKLNVDYQPANIISRLEINLYITIKF